MGGLLIFKRFISVVVGDDDDVLLGVIGIAWAGWKGWRWVGGDLFLLACLLTCLMRAGR